MNFVKETYYNNEHNGLILSDLRSLECSISLENMLSEIRIADTSSLILINIDKDKSVRSLQVMNKQYNYNKPIQIIDITPTILSLFGTGLPFNN